MSSATCRTGLPPFTAAVDSLFCRVLPRAWVPRFSRVVPDSVVLNRFAVESIHEVPLGCGATATTQATQVRCCVRRVENVP